MDLHGGSCVQDQKASGEEGQQPAHPCLQQQYSALGEGRMWRGVKLFSGLFLVSSLFLSLISPPKCFLSLSQWQEDMAWLCCHGVRGFGVKKGVQIVTQEAGGWGAGI